MQAPCPAAAPGSATAPSIAQAPAPCSPSSFTCGALQDIIVSGSLYSSTKAAIQLGTEQCVVVGNGSDCLAGNVLVDTITFAAISAGTCTPSCQGDAIGTLLTLQDYCLLGNAEAQSGHSQHLSALLRKPQNPYTAQ